MDDARAHECLSGVLAVIDQWGELYEARWGKQPPNQENPRLDGQVRSSIDHVRARARLARDIILAMGESSIAERVQEHEEGQYGGHPFTRARIAIVEAVAILAHREELYSIVGPVGPRLSATELHPVIWGAAAALWDDGHVRPAVQTACTALEGLLQLSTGPAVAGENLALVFSSGSASTESPRLRIRGVEPASRTSKSAHEGAAALVRGSFLAIRNLVSHPGWPDPDEIEGLEMLAVLSYVAHLIDRSELVHGRTAFNPDCIS